jgi:hypothetical protein
MPPTVSKLKGKNVINPTHAQSDTLPPCPFPLSAMKLELGIILHPLYLSNAILQGAFPQPCFRFGCDSFFNPISEPRVFVHVFTILISYGNQSCKQCLERQFVFV